MRTIITASVSTLLLAGNALAEDVTTFDDTALFSDIESIFGASKYEQSLDEAPSSVTLVTRQEIREQGYRDLAEVLASVRGFDVTDDATYKYVSVRGFGVPGDYNSRILLLVNGHRMNDRVYSSAALGPSSGLDLDLVERIEIIPGPGSALYGSSAMFAVVNVITRRGRDIDGLETEVEFSDHNSKEARVSWGQRGDQVEFVVSATMRRSDGEGTIYYPEFDDPATSNGFARDVDGEEVENLHVDIGFGGFTVRGAYSTRDRQDPTAAFDTVFSDPRTRNVDSYAYLDVGYETRLHGDADLEARVFYDAYDYDGYFAYDYADPGDPPWVVVNRDDAHGRSWGTELLYTKPVGAAHRVVAGLEYQNNFRLDQGNFDEDVYLDERHEKRNWAVYAQDEWRLTEDLLISGGVRYDNYDTFGGAVSPRAAVIYTLRPGTVLKGLYGTAFRAPNAFEQHYHDGNVSYKPARNLQAEEIQTTEVVLEQQLGTGFRAVLSAYRYEMSDLIALFEDPADDLLVYRNLDKVNSRGLEAEVEGRFDNGLAIRANVSIQHARADNGSEIANSPKVLGTVSVRYPLREERLTIGMEGRYVSERWSGTGVLVPSKVVASLALTSTLPSGWFSSFRVENLFDDEVGDPATLEQQQVVLRHPRSAYLSFGYRF